MKRTLSYFKAVSKLLVKNLATISISLIVLIAVCIGALFASSGFLDKKEGDAISISLGLVILDNDNTVRMLSSFLLNSEDFENVTISEYSYNDALAAIVENKIQVAIVFPEGFVDGLMYGKPLTLEFIIPSDGGFESALLSNFATVGTRIITATQAATYTADYFAYEHGLDTAKSDAGIPYEMVFIRKIIGRMSLFSDKTVSATSLLTTAQFYVCSGIILVLSFLGISMSSLFTFKKPTLVKSLKRTGISSLSFALAPLINIMIFFALIIAVFLIVTGFIPDSPEYFGGMSLRSLPLVIPVIFCIASFICAVYELFKNRWVNTTVLFFFPLIAMFISGCIIPAAFLPKFFSELKAYMPVTYMMDIFNGCILGIRPVSSVIKVCIFGIIFFLIYLLSVLHNSAKEK